MLPFTDFRFSVPEATLYGVPPETNTAKWDYVASHFGTPRPDVVPLHEMEQEILKSTGHELVEEAYFRMPPDRNMVDSTSQYSNNNIGRERRGVEPLTERVEQDEKGTAKRPWVMYRGYTDYAAAVWTHPSWQGQHIFTGCRTDYAKTAWGSVVLLGAFVDGFPVILRRLVAFQQRIPMIGSPGKLTRRQPNDYWVSKDGIQKRIFDTVTGFAAEQLRREAMWHSEKRNLLWANALISNESKFMQNKVQQRLFTHMGTHDPTEPMPVYTAVKAYAEAWKMRTKRIDPGAFSKPSPFLAEIDNEFNFDTSPLSPIDHDDVWDKVAGAFVPVYRVRPFTGARQGLRVSTGARTYNEAHGANFRGNRHFR